jgi:3-oxoacyl-[acyl-carrier protein] reductase
MLTRKGPNASLHLSRTMAAELCPFGWTSRAAQVEAMISAVTSRFGGLDIIFNNAGFSHRSMPFWELPESEFDRVYATNVKGVFLGAKYAIPALRARGGGVIINTASIGGVRPRPGVTVYNSTKGAVITMTRSLAIELAPFKIRVNAVNPVVAETGFIKGATGADVLTDEARQALMATIPLGRLTEPSDVAAAVCFLASDDAKFLTGVCLDVDGGRSI